MADLALVEKKEHRLTLDPKRWSYQDYSDFLTAVLRQKWENALPIVMKILVAWTYDAPITPDGYLDLPFPALPEVARSVNDTLTAYIEGMHTDDVEVNMTRWTMRDFFEYRDAANVGNVEDMERLMRKVCHIPGVTLGERLTFEQGALMSLGVKNATKDMFAAGK